MPTIETLSLPNFDANNIVAHLQLTADAQAQQAVISLLNAGAVTQYDFLCLLPASQTSELLQVNTGGVSGNAVTFNSSLALLHRNHEEVIKLFGNKIRIYKATNVDGNIPDDSAFSMLTEVAITPYQTFSTYTDPAGGSGFWYKFTYLNSYTGDETDKALSVAVRGGGWGNYCSVEGVRAEAGFEAVTNVKDSDIAGKRAAAESEIDGVLASAGYRLPLQDQHGNAYTPEIITRIDEMLAAGYVLNRSYGVTKPGSNKSGTEKIKSAREMLIDIQKNRLLLLDSNKQQLVKEGLVDGFPTEDQATDSSQVGPYFTMEMKL